VVNNRQATFRCPNKTTSTPHKTFALAVQIRKENNSIA